MEILRATCQLRPLQPGDAESLARHANDRQIWENLRDRFPHPYSQADAEEYIAHLAGQIPVTSFGIIVDACLFPVYGNSLTQPRSNVLVIHLTCCDGQRQVVKLVWVGFERNAVQL